MTTYVFNSAILTDYGLWRLSGPISPGQARMLLADGFTSAVGHRDTACLLSDLVKVQIPMARIDANLQPGDRAVVFRLLRRPEEGAVLSLEELQQRDYALSLLERLE